MKGNRASSTAYAVLQGLLVVGRKPLYSNLVTPEIKESCLMMLEVSEEGRRRIKQLDSVLYLVVARMLERFLMPGISLHYALRKRFIEDATHHAISQGVIQVVNLGAGFDTLSWRLHTKYPGVTFIELDHPATNSQKLRAVSEQRKNNLHFLAIDFTKKDLRRELSEFPVFDTNKATMFISEGVLMYLPEVDVRHLFHSLKELTGKGTRFCFSSVEPSEGGGNNTGKLLEWYLKMKGEPLKWMLSKNQLADFLLRLDYTLEEVAATDELRGRYLEERQHGKLHKGEYLAVAISN